MTDAQLVEGAMDHMDALFSRLAQTGIHKNTPSYRRVSEALQALWGMNEMTRHGSDLVEAAEAEFA